MLKKLLIMTITALTIVSVVGCSSQSKTSQTTVKKPDKIVIAYLPDEATEKTAEYRQGLQKDMEKALGVKVQEYLCSDYNAAIEGMKAGKVDIADFGPLSYVQAHKRAKAVPLVVPALDSDKSKAGYYSYIITQANNNSINSINDLKGKTFAFVDPDSTSGNLVPSKAIIDANSGENLTIDDLHANGKFFKSVTYSGSHQNGLLSVAKGDIDAAPCASDTFSIETTNGQVDKNKVKIVYTSPIIPGSPVAIRGNLDPNFIKQVKDFYLKYNNDSYFKNFVGEKDGQKMRYVSAEDSDYKYISDLATKFGLN